MSKADGRDDVGSQILELFKRIRVLESPKRIRVPRYASDPADPQPGEIWFNTTTSTLKVRVDDTTTKSATFT